MVHCTRVLVFWAHLPQASFPVRFSWMPRADLWEQLREHVDVRVATLTITLIPTNSWMKDVYNWGSSFFCLLASSFFYVPLLKCMCRLTEEDSLVNEIFDLRSLFYLCSKEKWIELAGRTKPSLVSVLQLLHPFGVIITSNSTARYSLSPQNLRKASPASHRPLQYNTESFTAPGLLYETRSLVALVCFCRRDVFDKPPSCDAAKPFELPWYLIRT